MKVDYSKIKLLVCDFDGVITNDKVIVDQDGKESVVCHRGDGLGVEMAKKQGIEVMVISKERNPVVVARCNKLKIECYNGIDTKVELLKKLVKEKSYVMDQVCYMGNDVNDIECVKTAGIGVAVADARPELIKVADYVTKKKGGEGAVREICDLILQYKK